MAAHGRELMDEAVRSRLVADVPGGVLLSGGLDSSALVALMHRQRGEPVRTFTVGFGAELRRARGAQRVRHFGTLHRDVVVTPDLVRDMIPSYLRWIDGPYADGSAIPTWCVSNLAREDVAVLLSGEGGDEAFAGYDTHAAFKVARSAPRPPRRLRTAWSRPGGCPSRVPPRAHPELPPEAVLGGIGRPPVDAHLWWRVVLTERKRPLYSANPLAAFTRKRPRTGSATGGAARPGRSQSARARGLRGVPPDDLVVKNDRMTMAHSGRPGSRARTGRREFLAAVPRGSSFPASEARHARGAAGLCHR